MILPAAAFDELCTHHAQRAHRGDLQLGFSVTPRLVMFGGGLPLGFEDDWIGVSGTFDEEDGPAPAPGIEAFGLQTRWGESVAVRWKSRRP